MSDRLDPCPHCDDPQPYFKGDDVGGHQGYCGNCGARGPLRSDETQAASAWNRLARLLTLGERYVHAKTEYDRAYDEHRAARVPLSEWVDAEVRLRTALGEAEREIVFAVRDLAQARLDRRRRLDAWFDGVIEKRRAPIAPEEDR